MLSKPRSILRKKNKILLGQHQKITSYKKYRTSLTYLDKSYASLKDKT